MTIIIILTYGLAVWRIARLVTKEDGPWSIFDFIRYKAGVRIVDQHDDMTGQVLGQVLVAPTPLAKLFSCPICFSFWVSLVLWISRLFASEVVDFIVIIGAMWGLATFLYLNFEPE